MQRPYLSKQDPYSSQNTWQQTQDGGGKGKHHDLICLRLHDQTSGIFEPLPETWILRRYVLI